MNTISSDIFIVVISYFEQERVQIKKIVFVFVGRHSSVSSMLE